MTAGAALLPGAAAAQNVARGVVFEDRNGNGKRDADEAGLAGVAVSNQTEVVLTGPDGRYSLPVTDDAIIFVSKPAAYAVPLSRHNLPRFYYVHKPAGSPKLYHQGLEPTGPLPPSIDFPLRAIERRNAFTMVVLADPQPETLQEVNYLRDDVLSELVGTRAAFGATLGDIVGDHLDLYPAYNERVGKLSLPFYNIIGNHDMNYDAADDAHADETFHRHFGPNYYSFNHGEVHFVALDSVEWQGPGHDHGHYRGRLGSRQLHWLANDLAHVPEDKLIVLLAHIPVVVSEQYGWDDRDQLFELLKNRRKVLALAGHMHYHEHRFLGLADGWPGRGSFHQLICATASGAWWSGPKNVRGIPVADQRDGTPNGYVMVTFNGTDYETSFKAAGADRNHQMRIYPPGSTTDDNEDDRRLLVNVFDGSARCRVEYALDGSAFEPMTRVPQKDPLAEALLSGVLDSGKPWATANICAHMWSIELPASPARGTHVVTIRVIDHFGRIREQSKIFTRR